MSSLTFVTDTGTMYALGERHIIMVTVDSLDYVIVDVLAGEAPRRYTGKVSKNWDFLVAVGLRK